MKEGIHPTYYTDAQVICACGNTWTTGSTKKVIHTDVCNKCHPFYTGQMKFVDTAGRVDAFLSKKKMAMDNVLKKSEKRALKRKRKIQKELEKPETLEEVRKKAKSLKLKAKS